MSVVFKGEHVDSVNGLRNEVVCYMASKQIGGQTVILQHFTKYVDMLQISEALNEVKNDLFGNTVRSYKWAKDLEEFQDLKVHKIVLDGNVVMSEEEFTIPHIHNKVKLLMSLGKDSTGLQSVYLHGLTFDDVKQIKRSNIVKRTIERTIVEKYGKLFPLIIIKEATNFDLFQHYAVEIDLKKSFNNNTTSTLIEAYEQEIISLVKPQPEKARWIKFSDIATT